MRSAAYDDFFEYKGYHGCASRCLVQIWKRPGGRAVVMLTEIPDNPGTSVTNSFEAIAGTLLPTISLFHGGTPPQIVWVEHYPETRCSPESFDLVTLDYEALPLGAGRFRHPRWYAMSAEQFAALVDSEGRP